MSTETAEIPAGLLLLREEVPDHLVGKLPKVTCSACSKGHCDNARHAKTKCLTCDAWISPQHIHLGYVGHAETTDRLLAADIGWNWEPLAFGQDGLPQFDANGGLWIRLTVCGVSRLGYGTADNAGPKNVGNLKKEIIGDAIRNAAMRFGHALNLWAKTDIHAMTEGAENEPQQSQPDPRTEAVASAGSGRVQRTHVDAPAPAAAGPRMADGQQKQMMGILFGQKLNADREERLRVISGSLGREVTTARDMTYAEAQACLGWLRGLPDFNPPQPSPTATDSLFEEFKVGIEGSASVTELNSVATGIGAAFQAHKLTEADRKALIDVWTERNKVLLDQAQMAGAA